MVGITINGVDLGLSASLFQFDPNSGSGGVIVDSGTTFTLLSSDAYNTVLQVINNFPTKVMGFIYNLPISLKTCLASSKSFLIADDLHN